MRDLDSVMAELRSLASEKTRATYMRHGMRGDVTLGVSVASLKAVAKTIRKQQALAMELYATGVFEAMYLAGIVADGKLMTVEQLQSWANAAESMTMVSEYTVAWVAVESEAGRQLARQWIDSDTEHVAAAGWYTLSGVLAMTEDAKLDLAAVKKLLQSIPKRMAGAANRVRYAMNVYVISVGGYVAPLYEEAIAIADRIGRVSVDVGDTACTVPVAKDYIAKMRARGVKKRKTLRC